MCLCVSTNVAVVVTVWVCQYASVCLHNVCELRSVRCMSPRLWARVYVRTIPCVSLRVRILRDFVCVPSYMWVGCWGFLWVECMYLRVWLTAKLSANQWVWKKEKKLCPSPPHPSWRSGSLGLLPQTAQDSTKGQEDSQGPGKGAWQGVCGESWCQVCNGRCYGVNSVLLEFTCWSPNLLCLRMWPDLEIESLQI